MIRKEMVSSQRSIFLTSGNDIQLIINDIYKSKNFNVVVLHLDRIQARFYFLLI